jgi:hypothetical protein
MIEFKGITKTYYLCFRGPGSPIGELTKQNNWFFTAINDVLTPIYKSEELREIANKLDELNEVKE